MRKITQSVAAFFLSFAFACSAPPGAEPEPPAVEVETVTQAIYIPDADDDPKWDWVSVQGSHFGTHATVGGVSGQWVIGLVATYHSDSTNQSMVAVESYDLEPSYGQILQLRFLGPGGVSLWDCGVDWQTQRAWYPNWLLQVYMYGGTVDCWRNFDEGQGPLAYPLAGVETGSPPRLVLQNLSCTSYVFEDDFGNIVWEYYPGTHPNGQTNYNVVNLLHQNDMHCAGDVVGPSGQEFDMQQYTAPAGGVHMYNTTGCADGSCY